jgi:hypothetical protein
MKTRIVKERTHLFAPSAQVVIKVDIDGLTSTSNLPKAIGTAVHQREILYCKIEMDSDGEAYYVKQEEPNFSITIADGKWEELAARQEHIPFDLQNGELIRFFILEYEGITQLLIVAHHLAGDGLSFVKLVEDIMIALTKEDALEYQPMRLFQLSDLPQDSKLNLITQWMVKSVNQKWNKSKTIFSFEEYQRMVEQYWSEWNTEIVCKLISSNGYDKLIEKAKEHQVSVNSMIATALLQAEKEQADIGITVNIRPNQCKGMGNYATGITVSHHYNENKSFFENAKIVHAKTVKKLSRNTTKYFLTQFMGSLSPTLIDAAYFATFDNCNHSTAKKVASLFGYDHPKGITLSNLTKLKIPTTYGQYQIRNFACVPPLVPNTNKMIGVATLDDTMAITLHILKDEHCKDNEAIFAKAISILESIE